MYFLFYFLIAILILLFIIIQFFNIVSQSTDKEYKMYLNILLFVVVLSTIIGVVINIYSILKNNNKVLCCGNGGSASDAQHFSAELLGRFECERPSLPAIALTADTSVLTAIANDYSYSDVFVRQIAALSSSSDVLVVISTSGNSENILRAIQCGHKNGMTICALTGKEGGDIKGLLKSTDFHLCVPSNKTSFIQEAHITILHCICDIIDATLFPNT